MLKNAFFTAGYRSVFFLACVSWLLAGCGSSSGSKSSDSHASSSTHNSSVSSSSATSSTSSQGLSLLRAEDTHWVDSDGKPVVLKGTNLGNWLLQEFWMMGQSSDAVNDQCTLENVLDERFGFDERERLMQVFRNSWITERDWDLMQDFGLNVIRLPFIWNLLEDENNPWHLREDAWHYLDLAIAEAEARNMYVILDLHGAVGSQGWEHHSGCSDKNLYWTTPEYQQRTAWLWQEIARRYKDRDAIAGYGLLNEPWGTTPENLAVEMKKLYDAIREIDQRHIIILPGHSAGIHAYGNPADQGMTNVAMEMHFYPGIFGWGEIGYAVQRDWLRCGPTGNTGVCEWDERLKAVNTPFLIGEFQPWTGQGLESGAEITRATYDTYGEYGWAATNWSYKVITNSGGQGAGTWGMVTNQKDLGVLAKANTWACAGWKSTFAQACDAATDAFIAPGDGEQTWYLLIKAGSTPDGHLDVLFDKVSITHIASGEEKLSNGNFGSTASWTEWAHAAGVQARDYQYAASAIKLPGSDGDVLRLHGGKDVNAGVYQSVQLTGGEGYRLGGVFSDNGSHNAWAEIYLVSSEPEPGVDVTGLSVPQILFHSAPLADIENFFSSLATMEYDIHLPLMQAMTRAEKSPLFDIPAAPVQVTLAEVAQGVQLGWQAVDDTHLSGYSVYRSSTPGTGYVRIASNITATAYLDTARAAGVTAYYVITAHKGMDESYFSQEVATAIAAIPLPGKVEAEHYAAMAGIQTETTTDVGGGLNVGWMDSGDWFEYKVNIAEAGNYSIRYRVASETGSSGFSLLIAGQVIDSQTIPNTGGWQTWQTISATVTLPAGEHPLRFNVSDGSWNLNWFEVVKR